MIGRLGVFGILSLVSCLASPVQAGILTIEAVEVTEWKSVYGTVETRDRVPARARISGTIETLDVTEGDKAEAGQQLALVHDDKFAFQLEALEAQIQALEARQITAGSELERGRALLDRGVITTQRMDQLRTDFDVIAGQIRSLQAERLVMKQRVSEGAVLSPDTGVVLSVPVARGSVVTPGETVAVIGGGGVFLRLAVPERHAVSLAMGDEIRIGQHGAGEATGRLVKLYPQIEAGRVMADVEVAGLDPRFVGRRVPLQLPVGERETILVPASAVSSRAGLDYVTVETSAGPVERAVVPGESFERDGAVWREILTGLAVGDRVVTSDE